MGGEDQSAKGLRDPVQRCATIVPQTIPTNRQPYVRKFSRDGESSKIKEKKLAQSRPLGTCLLRHVEPLVSDRIRQSTFRS